MPTVLIATFLSSETTCSVIIPEIVQQRTLDMCSLQTHLEALHQVVERTLHANLRRACAFAEHGKLANFIEGDFVLVAREAFHKGEKLCLCWRGPRSVIEAINDYVYQVEDLRNGTLSEVHAARLKFYSGTSLDEKSLIPHVLQLETGMQFQRLLRLVDTSKGLSVVICWRGFPASQDTQEPLQQVYADVPSLLLKLPTRYTIPQKLVTKAHRALGLLAREV